MLPSEGRADSRALNAHHETTPDTARMATAIHIGESREHVRGRRSPPPLRFHLFVLAIAAPCRAADVIDGKD